MKIKCWGPAGLVYLLISVALVVGCTATEQAGPPGPTLFLVGDSTMADQPEEKYPEQGWGQALPAFLAPDITLENHARNGRSSKSFVDEGRWATVLERLRPGDFVVLGFGHNDQKSEDPARYAAPWGDYRDNLQAMVDQVRARDGHPILVTSIYRSRFDAQGAPLNTLGDYPEVTRAVADQRRVPLVDLHALTRDMLLDTGVAGSADLYMQIEPGVYDTLPQGKDDNTHLQVRGARRVAGLFVDAVRAQQLPLAGYLLDVPLNGL